MKQYPLALAIVILMFTAGIALGQSVVGSKHDLSATGPGPYKAASGDPTQGGTSEICIFCHTPHSANPDAPLWNRGNSAGSYQTYTSDVLAGLEYYVAEDPKTGVQHSKTRVCLSCHDGTIALGSVVNMPANIPTLYAEIQMQGSPVIQQSAPGYIGIQLQDDHPVAIKHDTSKDLELVIPTTGGVRLYKDFGGKAVIENANLNYVECTSCHDPHNNQYGNFLVASNQGSDLCLQCHTKTGFALPTSIHYTAADFYSPPDGKTPIPGSLSKDGRISGVQCMNCHFPHKAGITETGSLPAANPNLTANPKAGYYLLAFQEEMSCFNNTNRWGQSVTVCHGSSAPSNRNIQTVETNNALSGKRHWTQDAGTVGRHEATEGRAPGWINNGGSLAKWHVECADCHNAHSAGGSNHTAGTNAVISSSPLYGTGGVSMPGSPRTWGGGQGSGYTYREPLGAITTGNTSIQYEYEICFKCHTDFAWGTGSVPTSPSLGSAMTDQAMEFNTANAAYHPVVGANTVNNQGTYAGGWTSGSTQTMYCSDCHTQDNGNRPLGPHGSGNSFILKKSFTDNYSTILAQTQPTGDICFDCHDSGVYVTGPAVPGLQVTGFYTTGGTNLHTRHYILSTGSPTGQFAYRCVNCHTRVPHGYTRKAMVVQRNEGIPYEAGGFGQGKISTANLPASGNYQTTKSTTDCSTVAGCHN